MKRFLLAISMAWVASAAHAQLPRPGVMIPASKVSISGYTNTDLQSGLSEGEIASIRPAADCTLVDGGKPNEICRDTDDQTLWICTNATECNHADWVAHGGGGGGSGDITNVGPGYSDGAAFTDGKASTGSTMFIWEGSTIDANEVSIISPCTTCNSTDINITLPSATSTLLGSVTAVAPVTGTPSSSNFLRGDGTWSTPSTGAATSLDSGQTGTTYDVKFGSATSPSTGWYYDIDGDGVVDEGEQLALPNRNVFTVTTMTGAGIQAAIDACGSTVPCEIRLIPGTYTDVCIKFFGDDQGMHLVGAGQGITTLKPKNDLDDCTETTNKEMIEINGTDNIEISDLTLDGDKLNVAPPTCNNTVYCGVAIASNSPGSNFAKNLWIHDITVENFTATAIHVQYTKHGIIERNTLTDLGCHTTDNICGNAGDGSKAAWEALSDIATVGQKSKGLGVVVSDVAEDVVVRDNIVTNTTYNGIEAFDGAGSGCGTSAAAGCVTRVEFANNSITQAQTGIAVNGGSHIWIHHNKAFANRATNGTGDTGSGLVVAGNSARYLRIEDNKIYDNTANGMIVKPLDGGEVVIARNQVSHNCLNHNSGSNLHVLSFLSNKARNVTIEDNYIEQGYVATGANPTFGCVYNLETYGGDNDFLGHTTILGNTVTDSGASGAVRLSTSNMFVHGMTVTGDVLFATTASGITLENEISGTTTYALGSSMTRLADGVLGISAGTSSGQLQLFEPSGSGSNKATIIVPALAADTNYTLPTTDGAASEFLQTNGSGVLTWAAPAGAGTITGVGPAFTTGLSFTDGTASTGNVMLVWEGSTVDTNEFSLLAPCTTCNASDINITFPATTGTLVGTGDTGGVTSAMITDDEIDVADIFNASTLASNPGYAANEVWFGSTGLIFEGTAANNIEGLLTAATITTADKTWTLPDATGTIVVSAATPAALTITGTPNGAKFLRDDGVWTAIPGGGDALVANPLSQFAATTSAQLYGVLSNETGSATGTPLAVFNQSPTIDNPTLTTPALGAATATSIVASGAITAASFTASPTTEPTLAFRDSNNADAEDSAVLVANCSVTTSTNEDCDVYLKQAVDGGTNGTIAGNTMKTVISSIADGAGTIGSDQNTAWSIVTAGTGDAALVVPTGSISGLEILDATITYSDVSHTETLAGNPANGASAAWWGTTGIIFEGSTSDASELLLTVADPAADVTLTLPASTGTLPVIIAQGTVALDTDAIASTACDTSDTAISATGTLSTDVLSWSFNADITAITGYAPATTGALIIYAYPSADAVNFKVCNPTTSSITPGSAVTLNWKVIR